MTLATRCSACGTSFRVVQDQLKVSGGWVRCGRCSEVFNAIEGLYEIGSPLAEHHVVAKPPPAPPPVAAAPVATVDELPAWPDQGTSTDEAPVVGDDAVQPPVDVIVAPAQTPEPEPEPGPEPGPQCIETLVEQPTSEDEPVALGESAPRPEPELADNETATTASQPGDDWRTPAWGHDEARPSFLVEAERAARWQQPRMRTTLGLVAALLCALLGVQAALAYRDILATRWPAAHAPLQQACDWLGCRIEPLRHMAALSVDASGLQQIGSATVYKLSVVIRNRSTQDVMAPSLDLVLSDSLGATVSRRVMNLPELGRPARVIPAGAEWSGQALLDTGERRISGYTIEIFYP